MGLELTPEVLTQKARETIARLGYEGKPADSAYGLEIDGDFQDWVEKHDKPHPDWNAVIAARPSHIAVLVPPKSRRSGRKRLPRQPVDARNSDRGRSADHALRA